MEKKETSHGTTDLEFGGVPGSTLMVVGLPVAVYGINLACNKASCSPFVMPQLPGSLWDFFDIEAFLIFIGWFGLQLLLYLLPIGDVRLGMPLKSGKKLAYRCNGRHAMGISVLLFLIVALRGYPVYVVYDKFLQIATSAVVFSYLLSIILYIKSLSVPSDELAANSGVFIYDFFLGHELNPRIGPLDLKFFCELRPGLIGWVIIDFCFVAKAFEDGNLTPALLLIVAFHTLYVADALQNEPAILTTMDIIHDGFGLMLVFGDLVWVPFLYSLQARYAMEHPQEWSLPVLAGFLLLNFVGYSIFRGANSQKNTFRSDPNHRSVAYLDTMETSAGKKLLVSGWWGMCRHPNYLGDLLMALAWSLPCGFASIIPYFYPIYFLVLLIHRCLRDEVQCRKKYGADWDKYCKKVKYRIFPYVF